MIELCCLVIFIVFIVLIVVMLLPKEHKVKIVQSPKTVERVIEKVYVQKCQKCGFENETGSKFCRNCGEKL